MEKRDILELILSGERITKKVKTKRGIFVIKFPLPRDLRVVEVRVAEMVEGRPISSFTTDQISNFRAYATLDSMIVDSPEWWKKMDSSEDCPDDDLIMTLYGRYLRFYRETQKIINNSKFNGEFEGSRTGNKT